VGKLMNDDLHNVHAPHNNMNMMKARRMRQEGNVARMGAMRSIQKLSVIKLKDRNNL
jgi:hypothetical protein